MLILQRSLPNHQSLFFNFAFKLTAGIEHKDKWPVFLLCGEKKKKKVGSLFALQMQHAQNLKKGLWPGTSSSHWSHIVVGWCPILQMEFVPNQPRCLCCSVWHNQRTQADPTGLMGFRSFHHRHSYVPGKAAPVGTSVVILRDWAWFQAVGIWDYARLQNRTSISPCADEKLQFQGQQKTAEKIWKRFHGCKPHPQLCSL